MRIAVVGSGYVGLVAGACFADLGHDVILVDNDERKLSALKNGQVPIHENFLPELLSRHRGQPPHFLRRSAGSRARQFRHLRRRGHAAYRTRRGRPVLRRVGRSRNLRRHQRIQSNRREEYGARSIPASGFAKSFCATAPTPSPSTSLPIPSSCAKAPPSPTFFFPTASSSAATPSAPPKFSAKSTLRSPAAAITRAPTPFRSPTALPFPPPSSSPPPRVRS